MNIAEDVHAVLGDQAKARVPVLSIKVMAKDMIEDRIENSYADAAILLEGMAADMEQDARDLVYRLLPTDVDEEDAAKALFEIADQHDLKARRDQTGEITISSAAGTIVIPAVSTQDGALVNVSDEQRWVFYAFEAMLRQKWIRHQQMGLSEYWVNDTEVIDADDVDMDVRAHNKGHYSEFAEAVDSELESQGYRKVDADNASLAVAVGWMNAISARRWVTERNAKAAAVPAG